MPFVTGDKKVPPTKPPAKPQALHVKSSGVLTPKEWAAVIVAEAARLGIKMTPRQVAEGLGVLSAEDGFNTSEESQGPRGHIGGWAESPTFGTVAQRLNPVAATTAALENWKSSGKSWWPAWGDWEKGETEGAGPERFKQYLPIAEAALKGNATVLAAGGGRGSAGAGGGSTGSETGSESSDLGGELLKIALVAVLVLGGVALIGLGGTRFIGASKAGKALTA